MTKKHSPLAAFFGACGRSTAPTSQPLSSSLRQWGCRSFKRSSGRSRLSLRSSFGACAACTPALPSATLPRSSHYATLSLSLPSGSCSQSVAFGGVPRPRIVQGRFGSPATPAVPCASFLAHRQRRARVGLTLLTSLRSFAAPRPPSGSPPQISPQNPRPLWLAGRDHSNVRPADRHLNGCPTKTIFAGQPMVEMVRERLTPLPDQQATISRPTLLIFINKIQRY
jgi:hypothetical protein